MDKWDQQLDVEDDDHASFGLTQWRKSYGVAVIVVLIGCAIVVARLIAGWMQPNASQPFSGSDVRTSWLLLSACFLVLGTLIVGGTLLVFGRRSFWVKGFGCILGLLGAAALAFVLTATFFLTFFDPN